MVGIPWAAAVLVLEWCAVEWCVFLVGVDDDIVEVWLVVVVDVGVVVEVDAGVIVAVKVDAVDVGVVVVAVNVVTDG